MKLKGKKICITGANGFLGTNVKIYFSSRGLDVFAPNRNDYDLTKYDETKRLFADIDPDILIHIAADVGGIGYNKLFPADIFKNNLNINLNILEQSSKTNIEKLVSIGSACAYPGYLQGELEENLFLEGSMHESVEVYGFSKRALYLGSKAYNQQYGLNSIFLILTNLYGPYDKFDPEESHVVAALIKKFIDAKNNNNPYVKCWGSGSPIREFLFVEDCAEAIFLATKSYSKYEPLNIGTGIGTNIKELANIIKEVVYYEGDIKWDMSMPDGAEKKILDITKMKEELKWSPRTSLKEGIEKTIEWYYRYSTTS